MKPTAIIATVLSAAAIQSPLGVAAAPSPDFFDLKTDAGPIEIERCLSRCRAECKMPPLRPYFFKCMEVRCPKTCGSTPTPPQKDLSDLTTLELRDLCRAQAHTEGVWVRDERDVKKKEKMVHKLPEFVTGQKSGDVILKSLGIADKVKEIEK
ncbi:hypothetical protein B0H63DRAFT_453468 [Podospora didyma]|uniref:Uncharacterized protein n=1 Tax=Podospora didyma TaxID=330526 RepID=A0AAE0K8N0_9PEZI|nr:hypothetical protein B0H63DRAFT_515825 [Podospora didyma]KAK3366360.1 hypothetical protein B0H63DRAFT_515821 [Podospora didyma]KAK3372096.1 hypothetical protein B0H63DRAFT_453468 [Podospora didyma]